ANGYHWLAAWPMHAIPNRVRHGHSGASPRFALLRQPPARHPPTAPREGNPMRVPSPSTHPVLVLGALSLAIAMALPARAADDPANDTCAAESGQQGTPACTAR